MSDAPDVFSVKREDLELLRSLFQGIRGDWTDPRDDCRWGIQTIDRILRQSPAENPS